MSERTENEGGGQRPSEEAVEVLLIEDNPGDARLFEEMLEEAADLHPIVIEGPELSGTRVYHEQRLAAGIERLAAEAVDVVLLDLGLPDSTGLETLAAVADATGFVPIVVLTGLRDEGIGLQAIQRGAQDYLVKDEVTSDLLVRSIRHAMERTRQERVRARQVEQLASLNRLNRISQDVTHDVITTESREELEQAVCERFVADDEYPLAWIGRLDRSTDRITPRAVAGAPEGYLDEVDISVDDAHPTGPTAAAIHSQEVQVVSDTQADPDYEPWREAASERGYRSSVAVPIVYEGVLYGVLNLYARSPESFSDPEVDILSGLGDVIGHAVTAIDRRDALVHDDVRELEFEVTDVDGPLAAQTADGEARLDVATVVRADEHLVAYGTATSLAAGALVATAEGSPWVEDLRVLGDASGDDEDIEFELAASVGRSLFEAVATRGGRVESATVADGEVRFVVQFPTGRDVRRLVDLVQDHCPAAVPLAQRTVPRTEQEVSDLPDVLTERLTDKQRSALESAYHAGYFDWPRTSTSEEVAGRLGVTAATFTHHLRAAEAAIFEEVFDGTDAIDGADWSAWSAPESDSASR